MKSSTSAKWHLSACVRRLAQERRFPTKKSTGGHRVFCGQGACSEQSSHVLGGMSLGTVVLPCARALHGRSFERVSPSIEISSLGGGLFLDNEMHTA